MRDFAEFLVSRISQAPFVSVREKHLAALDFNHDRIAKEFCADRLRKALSEHEVAVSGHDEDAPAGCRMELEERHHGLRFRVRVVAEPEVEKVAENHEFRIARRHGLHEAHERHDGFGLRG